MREESPCCGRGSKERLNPRDVAEYRKLRNVGAKQGGRGKVEAEV